MGKFDEMNGLICSRWDGLTFQICMFFFFFFELQLCMFWSFIDKKHQRSVH